MFRKLMRRILYTNKQVYKLSLFLLKCFNPLVRQNVASTREFERYLSNIVTNKQIFFIQVGSNDGESNDPLRRFIISQDWSGCLIEPVPYLFKKIEKLYEKTSNVKTLNYAVSDSAGNCEFFYLDPTAQVDFPGLPNWFDQIGSFDRNNIVKHFDGILEPYIISDMVQTVTLDQVMGLMEQSNLGLLHIDAEGFDLKILKTLDFNKYLPEILILEHKHLDSHERIQLLELLEKYKYCYKFFTDDVVAYQNVN